MYGVEHSIVNKFFRIYLRHIKRFKDLYLLSLSAKWTVHFLWSFFNNFKKIDSQNVPTQIDDLERRLCPQTQKL